MDVTAVVVSDRTEIELSAGYWLITRLGHPGKVFLVHGYRTGGTIRFMTEDYLFREWPMPVPIMYFNSREEAELGLAHSLLIQGG